MSSLPSWSSSGTRAHPPLLCLPFVSSSLLDRLLFGCSLVCCEGSVTKIKQEEVGRKERRIEECSSTKHTQQPRWGKGRRGRGRPSSWCSGGVRVCVCFLGREGGRKGGFVYGKPCSLFSSFFFLLFSASVVRSLTIKRFPLPLCIVLGLGYLLSWVGCSISRIFRLEFSLFITSMFVSILQKYNFFMCVI